MAIQQTGISLLIEGTSKDNDVLERLISVGEVPDVFVGAEAISILKEPLSYLLRHTDTHKCYTLIDRDVRPFGSTRKGALCVSIVISRDMQMANGHSPLILLREIYHMFVLTDMYAASSGGHIFNEGDYNSDAFIRLLDKYRLEKKKESNYVVMPLNGKKAVVCIKDDAQLSILMRDSQYPEFSTICQLEVGKQCGSTLNIEIPRKIHKFSTEIKTDLKDELGEAEKNIVKNLLESGKIRVHFANRDVSHSFVTEEELCIGESVTNFEPAIEPVSHDYLDFSVKTEMKDKDNGKLILFVTYKQKTELPSQEPPILQPVPAPKNSPVYLIAAGLLLAVTFFGMGRCSKKTPAVLGASEPIIVHDTIIKTVTVYPETPSVTAGDEVIKKIIDDVNKADLNALEKSLATAKKAGKITQQQRSSIEHLWFNTHSYSAAEKRIIRDNLQKRVNEKPFTSIEEIVQFSNEITERLK